MFRRPWTGVVGPVPKLARLRATPFKDPKRAGSRIPPASHCHCHAAQREKPRGRLCHCCRAQGHSPSCLLLPPFRFLWVKSPSSGFNLKRAGEAKSTSESTLPIRLITTVTGRRPWRAIDHRARPCPPRARHLRARARRELTHRDVTSAAACGASATGSLSVAAGADERSPQNTD